MKKLLCTHCKKRTQRSHPILGMPLCRLCEKAHPELYRWICQTTALKDYRLSKRDLSQLDSLSVPNPYYSEAAAPMKLYMLRQVENFLRTRLPPSTPPKRMARWRRGARPVACEPERNPAA